MTEFLTKALESAPVVVIAFAAIIFLITRGMKFYREQSESFLDTVRKGQDLHEKTHEALGRNSEALNNSSQATKELRETTGEFRATIDGLKKTLDEQCD